MRTLSQKQNQRESPVSSSLARPNMTAHERADREHPILHQQGTIENQATQQVLETDAEELKGGMTGAASPRFEHDFSRVPVHPPAAGAIQREPAFDKPESECEQGGVHPEQINERRFSSSPSTSTGFQSAFAPIPLNVPPIVHTVLNSSGRPLPSLVRAFAEPRFGADFRHVRIHDDASAAASAHAVNALAYTVGRDIVFDSGQYSPETTEGRRLISHELAHVVQQKKSNATSPAAGEPTDLTIAPDDDPLETDAKRVAHTPNTGEAHSSFAPQGRLYRQSKSSLPPTGTGFSIAPVRIVYLDASVIDKINRGSSLVANMLRRMMADSGVSIEIPSSTYMELTGKGQNLQLRAGNKQLISDLGIPVRANEGLAKRLDPLEYIAIKDVKLQGKDMPLVAESRLAKAEVWSFDTGVKQNAHLAKVMLARESLTSVGDALTIPDYATGRALSGLKPITIDANGNIITTTKPSMSGGGGSSGGLPPGIPTGKASASSPMKTATFRAPTAVVPRPVVSNKVPTLRQGGWQTAPSGALPTKVDPSIAERSTSLASEPPIIAVRPSVKSFPETATEVPAGGATPRVEAAGRGAIGRGLAKHGTGLIKTAGGMIKGMFTLKGFDVMILDIANQYQMAAAEAKRAQAMIVQLLESPDTQEKASDLVYEQRLEIARRQHRSSEVYMTVSLTLSFTNDVIDKLSLTMLKITNSDESNFLSTIKSHDLGGSIFAGGNITGSVWYIRVSQPLPPVEISESEEIKLKLELMDDQGLTSMDPETEHKLIEKRNLLLKKLPNVGNEEEKARAEEIRSPTVIDDRKKREEQQSAINDQFRQMKKEREAAAGKKKEEEPKPIIASPPLMSSPSAPPPPPAFTGVSQLQSGIPPATLDPNHPANVVRVMSDMTHQIEEKAKDLKKRVYSYGSLTPQGKEGFLRDVKEFRDGDKLWRLVIKTWMNKFKEGPDYAKDALKDLMNRAVPKLDEVLRFVEDK